MRGESSICVSSRRGVTWLLLLALILAAACGSSPPPSATATPTLNYPLNAAPPPVTPAAVAAQLTTAATLDAAAQQFAALMSIDPAAVRVRLDTDDCTTCSIVENQQHTSLAGLSVAEATERIRAGNQVYLVMPRFVCIFDFDGSQFSPRECRHTPL